MSDTSPHAFEPTDEDMALMRDDLLIYGTSASFNGKRIHPRDLRIPPHIEDSGKDDGLLPPKFGRGNPSVVIEPKFTLPQPYDFGERWRWFVTWGEEFQLRPRDPNAPPPSLWQRLKRKLLDWLYIAEDFVQQVVWLYEEHRRSLLAAALLSLGWFLIGFALRGLL